MDAEKNPLTCKGEPPKTAKVSSVAVPTKAGKSRGRHWSGYEGGWGVRAPLTVHIIYELWSLKISVWHSGIAVPAASPQPRRGYGYVIGLPARTSSPFLTGLEPVTPFSND